MLKTLLKWTLLAILVGGLTGVVSAAFFFTLNWSIAFRHAHKEFIYFLPFAGAGIAWVYKKIGSEIDSGTNLILDEIHVHKKHIPLRMVPMIFLSTAISHLFGASVGREGAAVQIGAGISDQFSKWAGDFFSNRKIILMVGISAGFSAIFGAPIAGTIFGMEVISLGTISYEAFFPCLLASIVSYVVALSMGVIHSHFNLIPIPGFSLIALFSATLAGAIFGLAARFFIWLLHSIKDVLQKYFPNAIYRPFIGGTLIAIFFYFSQNDRYLSLGEDIINSSFIGMVKPWDFLGKILSTSLSVGSGFKGGEVMSLFYIGATLGNALGLIIPLTTPLLAALGFVSVFAGAANTPITCLFLALGLFGSNIGVFAGIAIVMSYLFSGNKGLYGSQRKYLLKKL